MTPQTFTLPIDNRDRLIERVSSVLRSIFPGQSVEIVAKPKVRRRSDEQNRYLWGVVYPAFCQALEGWDKDDVHEYLLGEWSGWETIEGMGRKRLKPIRRSSRLNKLEFAEYVDFCQRRGAEHGIYVPDPESA